MAEIFRTGHCDANERRVKRLVSLHAGAQTKKLPCMVTVKAGSGWTDMGQ